MTPREHLGRAVGIAGGQVALARLIGRRQQHVWKWLNHAREVPADICPAIERATAGQVRCEDLRPDVDWAYLRGTACPGGVPVPVHDQREAA